ncbi:MAG TPA: hypothetical protein VGD78_15365 [Chthoniobacterales bacterium]
MRIPDYIYTYDQLRKVIYISLRMEHPEWVEPNGNCPNCDDYVRRLGDVLDATTVRAHEQDGTPGDVNANVWRTGGKHEI